MKVEISSEFLELFKDAFKVREDVHALKGKANKNYYTQYSEKRVYIPLSDDVLMDHLEGRSYLGGYSLREDNSCHFIAADLDDHRDLDDPREIDPYQDVKEFNTVAESYGFTPYVFKSKSGKGYHIYIFFNEAVPAWKARKVMFAMLGEAGIKKDVNSLDRLFPNQDEHKTSNGIGNCIGLEFQGEVSKDGNTVILDPATDFQVPYTNQLKALSEIHKATEADLDELISLEEFISNLPEKKVLLPQQAKSVVPNKPTPTGDMSTQLNAIFTCDFLKMCYDDRKNLGENAWWCMISNLSQLKPNGVDLCHYFSKDYAKYSSAETNKKILNAINGSMPQTCEYIKKNVFVCNGNCGVRKPIDLVQKHLERNGGTLSLLPTDEIIEQIIEDVEKAPKQAVPDILANKSLMERLYSIYAKEPAEITSMIMRIQNAGATQKNAAFLLNLIIKGAKSLKIFPTESGIVEQMKLVDIFENLPTDQRMLVPNGWVINAENGIEKLITNAMLLRQGIDDGLISHTPIVIKARKVNHKDGVEYITLAWYKADCGGWKERDIERLQMAKRNELVLLAKYGLDINDINALKVMEYLRAFEKINGKYMPVTQLHDVMGWIDKHQGFLWGNTYFQPSADTEKSSIEFAGIDNGTRKLAVGYHSAGTYECWRDTVNKIHDYPLVMAGLLFSLMAPFLDILNLENFIVNYSCKTSRGKSTSATIAASAWGNPDGKANTIFHTWSTTGTWIERAVGMLRGLPFFLDESKTANSGGQKDLADAYLISIIYAIVSGQGKNRANLTGLNETKNSRTIVISTGEQAMSEFSKADSGAQARVVPINEMPFGEPTSDMAKLIKTELSPSINENYGFAGPMVIQYMLDNKDQMDLLTQRYNETLKGYLHKTGNNSVLGRVVTNIAALESIIPIIQAALPGLIINKKEIVDKLYEITDREFKTTDSSIEALSQVYTWAMANRHKFGDTNANNNKVPSDGWAGFWMGDRRDYISIRPDVLEGMLKEYSSSEILREWKDKGVLVANRGFKKEVSLPSESKEKRSKGYYYCLHYEKMQDVLGLNSTEDQG